MNIAEHKEESSAKANTAFSVGDKPQTERLPPGRRLDMAPRRPRGLLLFTIALTLLLVIAVFVIRNNRPVDILNSVSPSVDDGAPLTSPEVLPVDPVPGTLEHRIDELGAQLAQYAGEADKKIDDNTGAIQALEDKLASLPTAERVTALEDTLKQSRDELTKDLARIEQSLVRLRRSEATKVTKSAEPTLPFQPVSLDLWDGVPYVGLLHDGRLELARVGQERGGWTVEHIDYSARKVRFRNDSGQVIERATTR